ncbi:MerR family transcriptional regulator [Chitinophaga cymbidii]|uniref:Uncharacterized protein n=1 Tax=Chitinophaga cymbidii TaxID=1096750 RepID=A0A512RIN7_9BACT|nr:helix-turn-helix domain-containing protein [Chitinophaga cymbidii]GEP95576.1 hypothetical protein CCY01nite_18360 [Chitinophaga cymbidii]
MERIEIISLTVPELQRMLDAACEKAIQKYIEAQKSPSDYEELTLEQAASELNCHKATVRRKMLEFGIKGSKIGREITIQRKDLKRIRGRR